MTKSEMMTRAHKMTRAARAKWPEADYRATLAAALRILWNEPDTLKDFLAQPSEKVLDYLTRAAAKCPKWAAQQTRPALDPETGAPLLNPETGKPVRVPCPGKWAEWMTPASAGGLERETWRDAVQMIAAEAWIILQDYPGDMPAVDAVCKAARAACKRLDRQTVDKPSRRRDDSPSLDDPDFNRRLTTRREDPETVAIQRAELDAYCRDAEDRLTVAALAYGLNQTETAAYVTSRSGHSVKQAAIARRLGRMRDRRSAAAVEQAANELDAAVMAAAGSSYRRSPEWRPDGASSSPGQR